MSDFTDAAVNRMAKLFNEGMSVADIGREMGISKSAVSGKIHRLRKETDLITREARPPVVREAMLFWTEERRAEFGRLFKSGMSDQGLAKHFGKGIGAVRHIRHEMGLKRAQRQEHIAVMMRSTKKKRAFLLAPEAERLEAPAIPGLAPLNLSLTALERHQCHYPYGHGRDMTFCGHPVAQDGNGDKRTYCAAHAAVCYQKDYVPDQNSGRNRPSWGAGYGVGSVPGAFHGRGHGVID